MTVGQRIKEIRKSKKMTLDELSASSKILKSSLSSWENDKYQPTMDGLIKLAKGLDVTIDYILGGETNTISNIIESHEDIAEKNHTDKDMPINNELLNTLIILVKETLSSKNEVISCKDNYIALQKEVKQEILSIKDKSNNELLKEKDDQISIYKDITDMLKKNNSDNWI